MERGNTITVKVQGEGKASADAEKAEAGTVVTLTSEPSQGYRFKEWQSGDVTIENNKFTMPEKAVTVTAVFEKVEKPEEPEEPEKPTVTISSSKHQINNGKDMSFTCSGKLEDLTGIYVDGKLVDAKHYTLKSGSTILTFKASYLDTLSVGTHTLKFQYKDNLSAQTDFTITAKAGEKSTDNKPDNTVKNPGTTQTGTTPQAKAPKTGDASNTAVYAILLVLSAGTGVFAYRRKKNQRTINLQVDLTSIS